MGMDLEPLGGVCWRARPQGEGSPKISQKEMEMAVTNEGASNPQQSTPQGPRGASSGSGSASTSPSSAPQPASHPELLLVTIQAKTGEIVKVESADSSGSRHELNDQDKAGLGKEAAKATLERLVEEAFEAGIACMLGD